MNPLRARLEYGLIAIAAWKFRWLPLTVARWYAGMFGLFAAKVLRIRREVALDNLKVAFPDLSDEERRCIYVRCWKHFVKVGAEMARLPRVDSRFVKRWIRLDGLDYLKKALDEGRGAIAVSGHFGNWEWMGAAVTALGMPVTYVVTSQTNSLVEDWMDRMRQAAGIEIVNRKEAVRGVLSALRRNRFVAMLCDQDASETGVFVPFFGRPASTPRGPAVFHLKTGTPLIFCTAPVSENGRYHIVFERLDFINLTGNREQDEETIMARVTAKLEQEIRKHPEQWLWLHRRWKSIQRILTQSPQRSQRVE